LIASALLLALPDAPSRAVTVTSTVAAVVSTVTWPC
jgi:hypothetical protein